MNKDKSHIFEYLKYWVIITRIDYKIDQWLILEKWTPQYSYEKLIKIFQFKYFKQKNKCLHFRHNGIFQGKNYTLLWIEFSP